MIKFFLRWIKNTLIVAGVLTIGIIAFYYMIELLDWVIDTYGFEYLLMGLVTAVILLISLLITKNQLED